MNDLLDDCEEYDFPLHGYVRLPQIKLEKEHLEKVKAPEGCSNYDFLRLLAWEGFKKLVPKGKEEIYKARVKEELELVQKLGFVDYILLIWTVYDFCDREKIATGFGRGSAPSLLLFFLIGVVKNIDPVKYGFVLQRFISEARAGIKVVDGITYLDGDLLCDFDADIAHSERWRVVEFLKTKHPNRVCKIANVSTLTSKVLIKDVTKIVMGVAEEEAKGLSDMIEKHFGVVEELSESYENNPKFKAWADGEGKEAFGVAKKLANLIRGKSQHASGYVVAFDALSDFMPVEMIGDEKGENNDLCSVYSMEYVARETIKLDILGVRCCSVVADVLNQIDEKVEDINLDSDPIIYDSLQNPVAKCGIFQLEQEMTNRLAKTVKAKNLSHLSSLSALSRPGAYVFAPQFAKYVNEGVYESVHPFFDDILKETGGIPIFQENLLFMANKVGFSLTESEVLRKIVGKKQKEKMVAWEQKIRDKVSENGLDPKIADVLWDLANASASYSFNKCIFEEEWVEHELKGEVQLKDIVAGDRIKAFDVKGNKKHFVTVKKVYHNKKDCYESNFEGYRIKTSTDHKFLCADRKMWPLKSFWKGPKGFKVFVDEKKNYLKELSSCAHVGLLNTIDLEVDHSDHNFYCNGIVVTNSHATCYSGLTALCLYLRNKHPQLFFRSLLSQAQNEPKPLEDIAKIQSELRYFDGGMKLLPPDLLKSSMDFTIEGKDIRFGLKMIKGVAARAITALNQFKTEHSNKIDLFDAAKESKLNISVLSALLACGALDSQITQGTRARLILEAQTYNLLTDNEKKAIREHAKNHDMDVLATLSFLKSTNGTDGKPYIKDSRWETIQKKYAPFKEVYLNNAPHSKLCNFVMERKMIGYSYSGGGLHEIYSPSNKALMPIQKVLEAEEGESVEFMAVVTEIKQWKSKKGNQTLKMEVEDGRDKVTCMAFVSNYNGKTKDTITEIKNVNGGKLPVEEDVLLIRGTRKKDAVFVNFCKKQNDKIVLKYMELKKMKDAEEAEVL